MADNTSITPAVIGLVGVLVGGIITAGSNYIVAIRKERADLAMAESNQKRELHRAARMIWVELNEADTALNLASSGWTVDTSAHARADKWDKYGSSLASAMPLKDWENLAVAYEGIYTLRQWYKEALERNRGPTDKMSESKQVDAMSLSVVTGNVKGALISLKPYLQ